MLALNDYLSANAADPGETLVFRHTPIEPRFRKALPLLAGTRPDLFNAYQAYQGPTVERSLTARVGGWLASFIAYGGRKAVFAGLYKIAGSRTETLKEFWARPENNELRALGYTGFTEAEGRPDIQCFDLQPLPLQIDWYGKLVIGWPPPDVSWYRRAHSNVMPIVAVREESAFLPPLPSWEDVEFTWAELAILPTRSRAALEQWRGIYLIWDASDGRSYVGSAYGQANILGRWEGYARSGHGGNKKLRDRDPINFRFTILQRVSPDMVDSDVIRLESSWKNRLHSKGGFGLNEN